MGKIISKVESFTDNVSQNYTNGGFNRTLGKISSGVQDVHNVAGKATLLSLSKAWIGIGLINPARTDPDAKILKLPSVFNSKTASGTERVESISPVLNRFDYERLYSLQLGEYFMPLSQTFDVRAKKRINVSSLVDGIDVIQQTRKETKTVDVKMRISMRPDGVHDNIKIVDTFEQVQRLGTFLTDLYENNEVFIVANDELNNTYGITYALISEYKMTTRTGMQTYDFSFSLMEVNYGDNVLTFDLRQITSDTGQIR